ncbi:MAG: PQQ-dependent sugar dehydrogenase [Rubrobacteraceae bacterium]
MFVRLWLVGVLVSLAGVSLVFLYAKPAAAAVPQGFDDRPVVSIQKPTSMAFTPDGRMLVSTQPGVLRMRKTGVAGTTQALDIASKVCSTSERGMLGVAIDPNFSSNQYVYIYYTYNKTNGSCPTGQPTSKDNPVNRVSRFTMSGDTVSGASEKVLIDNIPSPNGNHNGGDINFGKDGYLYISVGDGGGDYKNDSGRGGQNDASRDRNVLLGKILRVTRDGGIPATNPYTGTNSARCGVPSANGRTTPGNDCRETFARGLRNPFRMGFDPDASGTKFFINDVGQKAWEEIDAGKKGADYAWNLCEGSRDNPDRPGSVDCGSAPYTPPIHEYSHNSGCSSITGSSFVPDDVWPAAYKKSYLYGDFVCGKIFKLTPKSGGGYSRTTFASGLGRGGPVAMTFGPTGRTLYYTTYAGGDGGQIRSISYTRGNQAPDARITLSGDGANYGPRDKEFRFDGSGSRDPDGDPLAYEWDFTSDGTADAAGATASHVYQDSGKQVAKLTVKDGKGGVDSASFQVFPGNAPPQPRIGTPSRTALFRVGQKFTLRGSATDAQDGRLPSTRLDWEIRQRHNGDHHHPYFSRTGNNLSFLAPAPEDLSATRPRYNYLEIRLTATDEQGLKKTVTQRLRPKAVPVRFATRPANLKLIVNGTTFAAPKSFLSWQGHKLNIYAPRQRQSGRLWVFRRWSDGQGAKHTITTPAKPRRYIATFERRR